VPWIIDGVLVYVDDLNWHVKRARAAGATILSEIEEGPPGRRYRAGKWLRALMNNRPATV
jgi:PhnB protein